MNNEEIHNLLKIENDKTTIFTNQELKMIDDYIKELEAYKYNMDRDYLRLEKENQELKELIDTILNWNIFKNECPMNFGYNEETNEDKAQDLFYKDDDYCENNCNDDYKKCWLKYFKRMHELERVMVKSDSNE